MENFPIDKIPAKVLVKHPLADVVNPGPTVTHVTLTLDRETNTFTGYDFDTHSVVPLNGDAAPDLAFTGAWDMTGDGAVEAAWLDSYFGDNAMVALVPNPTSLSAVTSLDGLAFVDRLTRFGRTPNLGDGAIIAVRLDTPADLDPVYLVEITGVSGTSDLATLTFDYIQFG